MKLFIDNSRLVFLLTISIVVLGLRGLFHFDRESIPPVDFARALITTLYPGSSPTETEELITDKIEDEIQSVEGLKDVVSVSRAGVSAIMVRIDIDSKNAEKVIPDLHHAIQNTKGLPADILNPPKLQHITASNNRPMIHLILTGPGTDRKRERVAFQLKNRIEQVPGVFEVKMKGYRERELQILLSPEKMEKHHVSLMSVAEAVQKESLDIPAGYLESKNQSRHFVRLKTRAKTVKDLENIIVRSNFSGQRVRVKDIGQVIDGVEKELKRMHFHKADKGGSFSLSPCITIEVMKSARTDSIQLDLKVQSVVQQVLQTAGPDYQIHTFHSEGKRTRLRLSAVTNNALSGLFLVLLVFLFFLPSRIGLMAGLSLPLSILAVFSFLPFMGVTFNVITMLAFVICIGMLVDNSVVISEYHSRLLLTQDISSRKAALTAVRRFWKPISATVLTTVAAFLPMLVTKGVMGEFIRWIPIVVTAALLMSLFESFFLLPGRLQWIKGSHLKKETKQPLILRAFEKMETVFEEKLKILLKRKYLSVTAIVLFFVFSLVVNYLGNKLDIFSARSPEFYTAFLEPQPNSSLPAVESYSKDIAKQLYKAIGSKHLGSLVVEVDVKIGQIVASVKPSSLRKLNYKQILSNLRKTDKGDLKMLRFGIIRPGPPPGKALQAVIQSDDRDSIKKFIQDIYPEVAKVPGLINLEVDPDPDSGNEYQVHLDRVALARLGLNTQAAGLLLRTALEGRRLAELRAKGESFYIRLKYDEGELNSLKELQNIRLAASFGRLITLNKVARIVETDSEPDRKKYNFQPALVLQSEVDEKISTSLNLNKAVKKIIDKKIPSYPSLSYKLIGQQEATQESLQSLFRAMIIALFAILIILIVLFKSFLKSFLILSCIPLGFIGVIWAFFLHQRPLNFFALIGVVGLSGVVVNSAIILISYIERLRKEEPSLSLRDVAAKASKLRLKPILITNLTTLGGFFPTAYGLAGYEPVLMPMTLALFWGLLLATLLTLVWIPCGFLIISEGRAFVVRLLFKRKQTHL